MESYCTFSVLAWLPSLSIVIVRFIHVVSISHSFFLLSSEFLYYILQFIFIFLNILQFLYSLDRYLGYFLFLGITNLLWTFTHFYMDVCYHVSYLFKKLEDCLPKWTILFSWEQCIRVLALRILRIEVLEFDEV